MAWDDTVVDGVTIDYAADHNEEINQIKLKAPIASPTLTGTPAAPTPTADNSTTQIATTAFITPKFHATTGHTHNSTTGNGPALDHGGLVGLTDDDHVRYFDKDGSKAITGLSIVRDVNNSQLGVYGGAVTAGKGAAVVMGGCDSGTIPGRFQVYVPNTAKSAYVLAMQMYGDLDTPYLSMESHKITNLTDPTSDQDAATKAFVLASATALTSGMIVIWSGSIASIPAGYLLCNGASSTPNLRDRFVMGAGSTYAVGATGGSANHTNSLAEMVAHAHTYTLYGFSTLSYAGSARDTPSSVSYPNTSSAGSATPYSILNPYYALAYIMKT